MTDTKQEPTKAKNADIRRRSRWESLFQWTEILGALVSVIASIIAAIGVNLVSNLIAPRIPTSVVVALSIGLGVIIIVYVAVYLYRRQVKIRLLAISKLQERETKFFTVVENEISALLSERVG